MRYVIATLAAATMAALAGCDMPASTTASTTVVKEPVAQNGPVVQKEKETVIQKEPSTTIVQAPPQPSPPNVTVETSKPETIERSRSTSTTKVDTPYGTATQTQTESTKTTK